MKIQKITPFLVDRFLLVRVYTDAGIVGNGEAGLWAHHGVVCRAIEELSNYYVGQDPTRMEHHFQVVSRDTHFMGAVLSAALSAIDIALWDIAGKHLGVPSYQLLGGKVRDRARVYYHVFGETKEELIQGCIDAKSQGFTAVGHLTPFLDDSRDIPYFKTHVERMEDAIDTVRAYREAVGRDVDLCIEIHRQLTPSEAVVLGRGIEAYHPFFYEDPVTPDNLDEMALVASKIGIPIATGERIHTIWEFQALLQRGAVQFVRPDVCMVGGLSHAKKIAALAEAFHVQVVPHNPLSPVSTAACIQLAACIPNFALQEYPIGENAAPKNEIVKSALRLEDGFLIIPDSPGIGIELAEDAAERHPYRPREVKTRLHRDGSVVDQ